MEGHSLGTTWELGKPYKLLLLPSATLRNGSGSRCYYEDKWQPILNTRSRLLFQVGIRCVIHGNIVYDNLYDEIL